MSTGSQLSISSSTRGNSTSGASVAGLGAAGLRAVVLASLLGSGAARTRGTMQDYLSFDQQRDTLQERRQEQEQPRRVALKAPARVKLWHLLVAQLDWKQHGFTTAEVGSLLGIEADSVRKWCQQLYPRQQENQRGVYWLEFLQVVKLMRVVCECGRKLPDRDELYCHLLRDNYITLNFPADCEAVIIAEGLVMQESEVVTRQSAAAQRRPFS